MGGERSNPSRGPNRRAEAGADLEPPALGRAGSGAACWRPRDLGQLRHSPAPGRGSGFA
jgi:hypothetical protein